DPTVPAGLVQTTVTDHRRGATQTLVKVAATGREVGGFEVLGGVLTADWTVAYAAGGRSTVTQTDHLRPGVTRQIERNVLGQEQEGTETFQGEPIATWTVTPRPDGGSTVTLTDLLRPGITRTIERDRFGQETSGTEAFQGEPIATWTVEPDGKGGSIMRVTDLRRHGISRELIRDAFGREVSGSETFTDPATGKTEELSHWTITYDPATGIATKEVFKDNVLAETWRLDVLARPIDKIDRLRELYVVFSPVQGGQTKTFVYDLEDKDKKPEDRALVQQQLLDIFFSPVEEFDYVARTYAIYEPVDRIELLGESFERLTRKTVYPLAEAVLPPELREVNQVWYLDERQQPLFVFNADGSYGAFEVQETGFVERVFATQTASAPKETLTLDQDLAVITRTIGSGADALTHEYHYRDGRYQGRRLLDRITDRASEEVVESRTYTFYAGTKRPKVETRAFPQAESPTHLFTYDQAFKLATEQIGSRQLLHFDDADRVDRITSVATGEELKDFEHGLDLATGHRTQTVRSANGVTERYVWMDGRWIIMERQAAGATHRFHYTRLPEGRLVLERVTDESGEDSERHTYTLDPDTHVLTRHTIDDVTGANPTRYLALDVQENQVTEEWGGQGNEAQRILHFEHNRLVRVGTPQRDVNGEVVIDPATRAAKELRVETFEYELDALNTVVAFDKQYHRNGAPEPFKTEHYELDDFESPVLVSTTIGEETRYWHYRDYRTEADVDHELRLVDFISADEVGNERILDYDYRFYEETSQVKEQVVVDVRTFPTNPTRLLHFRPDGTQAWELTNNRKLYFDDTGTRVDYVTAFQKEGRPVAATDEGVVEVVVEDHQHTFDARGNHTGAIIDQYRDGVPLPASGVWTDADRQAHREDRTLSLVHDVIDGVPYLTYVASYADQGAFKANTVYTYHYNPELIQEHNVRLLDRITKDDTEERDGELVSVGEGEVMERHQYTFHEDGQGGIATERVTFHGDFKKLLTGRFNFTNEFDESGTRRSTQMIGALGLSIHYAGNPQFGDIQLSIYASKDGSFWGFYDRQGMKELHTYRVEMEDI
ncbi:MAG: hypothetical protein Q8R78_01135, partial [Candidatus Omnitrophota bacterium]|nr:hypothetical protein [Candidatus Omnitrophota bacterium]